MNKILFLVSGNGGLIKFIFSCIEKNFLRDYSICAVIADRDCTAIDFVKSKGISCYTVKYNATNRIDLLNAMNDIEFDVAITTISKILDNNIVNRFNGKLINVHPSLLPAFKGLHAVDDAVAYGVKFMGTTVHFVNEEMDAGKIISQSATPIGSEMSLETVMDSQFRAWCLNLLNVLSRRTDEFAIGKTENYKKTMFNPPLCFDIAGFDENFWSEIKNG